MATQATKQLTKKIVLAEFDKLGNSHHEYAAKLEELGIKGTPGDEYACPLVNWARRVFADYLCPGNDEVRIDSDVVIDGVTFDVNANDVPAAISDFMDAFDHGRYPQLEDKRSKDK